MISDVGASSRDMRQNVASHASAQTKGYEPSSPQTLPAGPCERGNGNRHGRNESKEKHFQALSVRFANGRSEFYDVPGLVEDVPGREYQVTRNIRKSCSPPVSATPSDVQRAPRLSRSCRKVAWGAEILANVNQLSTDAGQIRSNSGRVGPTSAELGLFGADMGRVRPTFGQLRPNCVNCSPTLGRI